MKMTVEEAIRTRKSVRRYRDKTIEEEKIQALLEAARLAPSASNRQEGRFVVVTDTGTRKRLVAAAANQNFVGEAACVIVCCAETDMHEMKCGQLCYPIDVAIQIDHMALRAVELELGTCWIGAFYEDQVKEVLGIPDDVRVVELLTVGYPADPSIKGKNRLPLDRIAHYEKW
jgi:nitroreductase